MKKYTNDNVRKLTRTGRGSYYVVIPKELVKDLDWKEKQKLSIRKIHGGITIKDWKK